MTRDDDRVWLDLAARLALRGRGLVEPNPCVGCVIVRDGRILGMGHHKRLGDLHAEREALESCRRQGNDPRGATMYVTLEPCAHVGRQPPCTEAIFRAGIERVVYARRDPHPVSGRGAEVLRDAGVDCRLSGASPSAVRVSDPFVKKTTTGLPWVIAKWAQTIDGRIATRTGQSQWISNERSRYRVHRLRTRVDCILTALGTVMADDPRMTPRGVPLRRTPTRVICDTQLEIPEDRRILERADEIPTIVACDKEMAVAHIAMEKRMRLEERGVRIWGIPSPINGRVNLELLLRALVRELDATTVLIEAGPGLLGSLFAHDLVDEAVVYLAPMLLADEQAPAAAVGRAVPTLDEGRHLRLMQVKRLGDDLELTYRRDIPSEPAPDAP